MDRSCDLIVRAACFGAVLLGQTATAWGQERSPKVWDIKFGTHVSDLPADDFVDPACGTNGGPPGVPLGGFEQFEKCRAEPSGLREIWFRYDDEAEYIARAARDADAVARSNAMTVLGQPVTLSLLIDPAGHVQGYRIFTDPHAEAELRKDAYRIATAFKFQYGAEGFQCSTLPAAAGETPIDGVFVKERCEKLAEGQQITLEGRHYYKPGQAMIDRNTGLPTINQFESSTRIEVVRSAARPQ